MHLKKLELSGFKSFAKTTVLEFPARVTAIIGPNGSGKSNIAEAIRWVLGEQSMKALRGKKGEDLVWNGSPPQGADGGGGVARMGKASVSLAFDNRKKELPIAFDEVMVTRKIFRDGANEYLINQSPVRLKDVVELIARMGLGEQKHNIISQGEVDRLLMSTPRERREMLEEALGLRVWQLKKTEAERKLEATRRNTEQAESLIRELAPHVKFLRAQAKRAEAATSTRLELEDMECIYAAREEREITDEEESYAARRRPLLQRQTALHKDIARLTAEIKAAEQAAVPTDAAREQERRIAAGMAKRQELERKIGRLEGRMEAVRHASSRSGSISSVLPRAGSQSGMAAEALRDALARIRALVREQTDLEIIRSRFFPLMERAEQAFEEMLRGHEYQALMAGPAAAGIHPEAEALEDTLRVLGAELEQAAAAIAAEETAFRSASEELQAAHERLRALEKDIQVKYHAEREAMLAVERLQFDEERVQERRRRLKEMRQAGVREERSGDAVLREQLRDVGQEELHRRIERLRIRLEETGGIDPAVVKEYAETEARHAFLIKEREDVAAAAASLAELVKELDQRIAQDFKEGFAKIKDEFDEYFRIVFGGGSGKLRITNLASRSTDDDTETSEVSEEGIEIEVDLPRKRIHGLAMLSGGERALTAIALLFAITAVNPPPFLVLDETDAALDEANSQRYAEILKELARHTQLIVVTHNRETMKSAGVLYGVTMGDDGVSRLLSLKLEEAEEYTNQ